MMHAGCRRTGFQLDRPQTEGVPAPPAAQHPERVRSPPGSREGSVRRGDRALYVLAEGGAERKQLHVPKPAAEEIV